MTSKQILDAFSEGLISDERILSSRERELVMALLQNAKGAAVGNREVQTAVLDAIRRSIGETVAQRAFTLLGSNIVEQIVSQGAATAGEEPASRSNPWTAAGPQPPTGPTPTKPPTPPDEPGPVTPQGPQPPTIDVSTWNSAERHKFTTRRNGAGVLEATQIKQAKCVVLDEFLAPQELEKLVGYTLRHESQFKNSEVIAPTGETGVKDYSHRRSRVLMELGEQEDVILARIRQVLPLVLDQLEMDEFPITRTEVQITASNDGDFFRAHCDDAQQLIASRRLTFVYFFHRDPMRFSGGELRMHDSRGNDDHSGTGSYETIVPQQNQIVFFPCSTLHEITPVRCTSREFADSRFTVNGWLHH
jgi:Rps23 Pro-64 3,4-dihydroxylase Tpa1-like proline 4-hydroxylase